jgi:ESCRT-I complex subunit VPS28
MAGYSEMREVRLWSDKKEREMYDNFADLFAIVKTMEKLEKAYVRDVISAKEYESACTKLIAQFRTLKTALKDTVPDVERFMETYKMDCPAALNRLLVSGVPANVEHKTASSDSGTAAAVAECVQHYITAMDNLKLNMLAVDQVSPVYVTVSFMILVFIAKLFCKNFHCQMSRV